MSSARMKHYQSLLLTERVGFASPAILNPATLLPEANDSASVHRCLDILVEETGPRSDLRDQLWPGSPNWYTDGNSFVVEELEEMKNFLESCSKTVKPPRCHFGHFPWFCYLVSLGVEEQKEEEPAAEASRFLAGPY
ncbi:uncharacterized protein LOC143441470 [Arvicanthis niloticus]|uniref:uncharacterized protein LOC143311688 n=1 Tax=Arvicanthis niloticus TaxID=61156 RepID=UPI00402B8D8C